MKHLRWVFDVTSQARCQLCRWVAEETPETDELKLHSLLISSSSQ